MALTYPLALPEVPLLCKSFGFAIPSQSSATNGGSPQRVDWGRAIFQAEYETPLLRGADFAIMTAWERAVRKATATVLAWDTRARYPLAYAGGGFAGLSRAGTAIAFDGTCTLAAVGSDGYSLILSGLPAGFVMTPGDGLSFKWDGTRYAYHSVADLTVVAATDAGLMTVNVDPATVSGYTTGVTVTLEKPVFYGYVSQINKAERENGRHGVWGFTVIQSHEAA